VKTGCSCSTIEIIQRQALRFPQVVSSRTSAWRMPRFVRFKRRRVFVSTGGRPYSVLTNTSMGLVGPR